MNHIQRLTQDNAEQSARLAAVLAELQDLRSHLLGPKFQGVDTDGERKDWIATADVLRRLDTLQSITNGTN